MTVGVQAFDANGILTFDTTSRYGRVLGTASTTANATGSISNADFSQGIPFVMVFSVGQIQGGETLPEVSFIGNVMSWTAASQAVILIYGVY